MEGSNNYGHQHPLLLILNQDQLLNVAKCSRCRDKVSTPCFGCAEDCGFYLHKVCAEAPLELNHPFHPHHPLLLMQNAPYPGGYICNFCNKSGRKSVYRCSTCELDFHIKCALFTFNIAENNLKELDHVALQVEELEDDSKCFGCREPLAKYTHFSPNCGFNLHEKCAELPFKLNLVCHREHPLVCAEAPLELNHPFHLNHPLLMQNAPYSSGMYICNFCNKSGHKSVYRCSSCELNFHIKFIKSTNHEHSFTLLLRQVPFTCDGCGTEGNHVAYTCCTCNIIIHKNCISLPRIIKSKWHDHRLLHTYFHHIEDFRVLRCLICHYLVNTEHGSYYCSKYNGIFHVKCVMKDKDSYEIVENEDEIEMPIESSIIIIESNDAGEATKIKHFKHMHNLMLGPFVGGYENSCDGCMLPISDPFYYCSECAFFLHKACAELPKMKNVWHHGCKEPLALISDKAFLCRRCWYVTNAFAYECCGCEGKICLRCVIALTPGARTCLKHEHPLFYYPKHNGKCNACGRTTQAAFCCKDCNFVLHLRCFSLPITAHHKCDEHLLSLTDHDDNKYLESHHCDICEESRDSKLWFYNCSTCDTSAHVNCVLRRYPFLKLGSIHEGNDHPHPLTIVKKYYYPDCDKCGKPCEGMALECSKSECKFIVHWKCEVDSYLWGW
uniref:Phorbol-ester/DAG-type domain-containing protein n=1 Tax=Gossypium raimondii TaxID=29730 RepID=A0A0D2R773_GOSRA|nr:hypothetical protein B456_005G007300 [Gossypium raimondii]